MLFTNLFPLRRRYGWDGFHQFLLCFRLNIWWRHMRISWVRKWSLIEQMFGSHKKMYPSKQIKKNSKAEKWLEYSLCYVINYFLRSIIWHNFKLLLKRLYYLKHEKKYNLKNFWASVLYFYCIQNLQLWNVWLTAVK